MSMRNFLAAAAILGWTIPALAESPELGQPVSPDEIPVYASYVMPDGTGLPAGSGTPEDGATLYAERCAACHGETGTEGPVMPPVGPNEVWAKPAGRYWPYATTLFDYIRRAMPFDSPKSLSNDEIYAVTAFILNKNGVIEDGTVIDATSLPGVTMPNRDAFIDVWSTQGEKPW